jgi:hypothetical protein
MRKLRSSRGEIKRVLHLAEPNTHGLSRYLAETWEHVAVLLGVEPEVIHELMGQPDREIAPKLAALVHRCEEAQAARRAEMVRPIAVSAAERLAHTAIWQDSRIYLDTRLLLGNLLVDTSYRYIALSVQGEPEVRLPRTFLAQIAEVLNRQYDDLGAWIDSSGLHIRWKEGRGGLNLISQTIPVRDMGFGLHVHLLPHVIEPVLEHVVEKAPAVQQHMVVELAQPPEPPPQAPRLFRPHPPPRRRSYLGNELAAMALLL